MFRKLKIFKVVAELRSFTEASENLFLSQPAVSKQIKSLEDYYGTELFIRSDRGITLTAAGNMLLKYANDIFSLVEDAKASLDIYRNTSAGLLRLGVSFTVADHILPHLLPGFIEKNHNISIKIFISDAEHVLARLQTNMVDIGLTGISTNNPTLISQPLCTNRIKLVVPNNHHWTKNAPKSLNAFTDQLFILWHKGSGTRNVIDNFFEKVGIKINVILQVSSDYAIAKLVESGIGVSLLDEMIFQELRLSTLKLLELPYLNLKHHFYLIHRRQDEQSEILNSFIRHVEQINPSLNYFIKHT